MGMGAILATNASVAPSGLMPYPITVMPSADTPVADCSCHPIKSIPPAINKSASTWVPSSNVQTIALPKLLPQSTLKAPINYYACN